MTVGAHYRCLSPEHHLTPAPLGTRLREVIPCPERIAARTTCGANAYLITHPPAAGRGAPMARR